MNLEKIELRHLRVLKTAALAHLESVRASEQDPNAYVSDSDSKLARETAIRIQNELDATLRRPENQTQVIISRQYSSCDWHMEESWNMDDIHSCQIAFLEWLEELSWRKETKWKVQLIQRATTIGHLNMDGTFEAKQ